MTLPPPTSPEDDDEPLDPQLQAIAGAILDGETIDWASWRSGRAGDFATEFRIVSDLAGLHRSLSYEDTAASRFPPELPWTIGALSLTQSLGRGSFGEVFRAWDSRLQRDVAVKLLFHDRGDEKERHGFLGEGRLLAKVRHPNVVTVYGADLMDGRVGLITEFVDGRTLADLVRAEGPLPLGEAIRIGVDLCRALNAVHDAGLLHRDIKPQNVMRQRDGRVVLMDFGAGHHGDAIDQVLAGTPLFLAPELLTGTPATVRSDVYSVGVLLYHLVTGSYPVNGGTLADIRDAHAQRRRTRLNDTRPDLPDAFQRVVERALDFDPQRRYESAAVLGAALSDRRSFARPAWIAAAALAVALVIAMAVMPAPWRSRILGGRGGSPPSQSAAPALDGSSLLIHKVAIPAQYTFAGGPSRDGRLFSFADTSGNVAIVDLPTGQVRQLTHDAVFDRASQFAEVSAISADSRFVAYTWWTLEGHYELRTVDVEGKQPRVLMRNEAVDYPQPIEWSRDGKWILSALTRPDHTTQLALVSVDDGTVRAVKELGTAAAQHASLSPDGEFVVYDAPQQASAAARDIFIVRSDGSEDRRLVEGSANDASPVWTPDGRRVLFASDRSGTMDLWGVDVDRGFAHGDPGLVQRNMGRMWLQGLTDPGSYFYSVTAGAVDVYEADLAAGAVKNPLTLPTTYYGSNISSIWSPDGRSLAYASRRGLVGFDRGSTTLVIRDLQTHEQRELVPALNRFLLRSWSPDGRQILVIGADVNGRAGNYQIDRITGRVAALARGGRPSEETDVRRGIWMSDGRVLLWDVPKRRLIARNLLTGVEEIVLDLKAEGVELATNGVSGRGYALSPDGQTIAFTAVTSEGDVQTRTLAVKTLGGGPARELARASGSEMIMFQDWMPDGGGVLFTRWIAKPNEPAVLWHASIDGGDARPLGLSMIGLRDVSVHPNGRKITFTAGWPGQELWVIENLLSAK